MNKRDDRTPLRKAVDKLIADGKIKQDKDLQEIFSLKKSTISAYLNNPKPGKRFILEFEKKFGVSLNEFDNVQTFIQTHPDNDHIQGLKKIIELLEEKNRSLEKEVLRNLMMNQEFLKGMMAQIRAASRLAAEFYAAGNKKKLDESLNTLDKYVSVFREEMK